MDLELLDVLRIVAIEKDEPKEWAKKKIQFCLHFHSIQLAIDANR